MVTVSAVTILYVIIELNIKGDYYEKGSSC